MIINKIIYDTWQRVGGEGGASMIIMPPKTFAALSRAANFTVFTFNCGPRLSYWTVLTHIFANMMTYDLYSSPPRHNVSVSGIPIDSFSWKGKLLEDFIVLHISIVNVFWAFNRQAIYNARYAIQTQNFPPFCPLFCPLFYLDPRKEGLSLFGLNPWSRGVFSMDNDVCFFVWI